MNSLFPLLLDSFLFLTPTPSPLNPQAVCFSPLSFSFFLSPPPPHFIQAFLSRKQDFSHLAKALFNYFFSPLSLNFSFFHLYPLHPSLLPLPQAFYQATKNPVILQRHSLLFTIFFSILTFFLMFTPIPPPPPPPPPLLLRRLFIKRQDSSHLTKALTSLHYFFLSLLFFLLSPLSPPPPPRFSSAGFLSRLQSSYKGTHFSSLFSPLSLLFSSFHSYTLDTPPPQVSSSAGFYQETTLAWGLWDPSRIRAGCWAILLTQFQMPAEHKIHHCDQ